MSTERNVIIQRAGSLYRARYRGGKNSTFGTSPRDAASKLKFFKDDSGSTRNMLAQKHSEEVGS
jgi:hypothetical protein